MNFLFKSIVVTENQNILMIQNNEGKKIVIHLAAITAITAEEGAVVDDRVKPSFGIRHADSNGSAAKRPHFSFLYNTGFELNVLFNNQNDFFLFQRHFVTWAVNDYSYLTALI